jgi:hypothetical protein
VPVEFFSELINPYSGCRFAHLLQRHRDTEVTLFVGHASAVKADELGCLNKFLDLIDLSGAGQHAQVAGMSMLMFTIFALFDHFSAPFPVVISLASHRDTGYGLLVVSNQYHLTMASLWDASEFIQRGAPELW